MEQLHEKAMEAYKKGNNNEYFNLLKQGELEENDNCIFLLALTYIHGEAGMQKNVSQGIQLLNKASERYHLDAVFTLGDFMYRGTYGVPKNKQEGKKLIRKAALMGNVNAMWALNGMYCCNILKRKRAAAWGIVAAEFYHPEASQWVQSLSSFPRNAEILAQKIVSCIHTLNYQKSTGDTEALRILNNYSTHEF